MSEMETQESGPQGDSDVRHTGSFGVPPDDDAIASLPTLDY